MALQRIFISYSRHDQKGALDLAERLRAAGFTPWVDQKSIPVSVPWLAEINHAIRASVVFVIFDSAGWRASKNCAHEAQIAQGLVKPAVRIPADSDPETWAERVGAAYMAAAPTEALRAQLLGDSERWRAANQPADHLPRGRLLRGFRAVLPTVAHDGSAHAYVGAGRRAALRRGLVTTLVVLLSLTLWLSWRVADSLTQALPDQYEETLAGQRAGQQISGALARNPYQGLSTAIEAVSAADSSDSVLWGLSKALDVNVPVRIEGSAEAVLADPLPETTLWASTGSMATYLPDRSQVLLTSADEGLTVPAKGPVTALAWAPDGNYLAIAESAGVRVVDARRGVAVDLLRGLDAHIDQLDWPEPNVIHGHSGGLTATWQVAAHEILSVDGSWYMDLAANPDRTVMYALGRGGTVTRIMQDDVSTPVAIPNATGSYSIEWIADRWVVGSATDSGGFLTTISETGEVTDQIDLGDCWPTALAAGETSTALVVCFADFGFRTVDLDTHEIAFQPVDTQPTSVALGPRGDVLVGSHVSELFRAGAGGGELIGVWGSMCVGGAEFLLFSPDGRKLLKAGASARSACIELRDDPDDLARTSRIVPDEAAMTNVRAATWSPDGRFLVLGFTSGHVWVYDTEVFYPRQLTVPTGSEIRGLAFTADGQDLIAVTRNGEVIRVSATLAMASTQERVAEARARWQVGAGGGLA